MFFGRPSVIPDRNWFDMESQWHQQFETSDLDDKDRVELGLLLHSMFGFSGGYAKLFLEAQLSPIGSPEQSFYLNSLRTMCVSYFIGTSRRKGDVNIRDILEKHELSHLLEPIDEILETSLGSTSFKDILTKFRNKYLMHELFQLHPLETLYESFDLRDDFNWIVYNSLEDSLFKETEKVFYSLRERYPEAWMFVGYRKP